MEENHYTSLEAVNTLIHALDYIVKQYMDILLYPATANRKLVDELLDWYLYSQELIVNHICQEFIK